MFEDTFIPHLIAFLRRIGLGFSERLRDGIADDRSEADDLDVPHRRTFAGHRCLAMAPIPPPHPITSPLHHLIISSPLQVSSFFLRPSVPTVKFDSSAICVVLFPICLLVLRGGSSGPSGTMVGDKIPPLRFWSLLFFLSSFCTRATRPASCSFSLFSFLFNVVSFLLYFHSFVVALLHSISGLAPRIEKLNLTEGPGALGCCHPDAFLTPLQAWWFYNVPSQLQFPSPTTSECRGSTGVRCNDSKRLKE